MRGIGGDLLENQSFLYPQNLLWIVTQTELIMIKKFTFNFLHHIKWLEKQFEDKLSNLPERAQFFPNFPVPFMYIMTKWESYLTRCGDILIPIVHPFNYSSDRTDVRKKHLDKHLKRNTQKQKWKKNDALHKISFMYNQSKQHNARRNHINLLIL